MTSLQKERIEFIDFAKGFAVLTIVLYHFLDQIYLIYPLLRGAQGLLRPGIFLLMGGLLSVGYWILIWSLDKGSLRIWNSFFLAYLWEFVLGMYLAKHPFSLTWMKRSHWEYGIVAILGTAIMAGVVLYFGEAGRLFNDIPALLGYTAICLLTFRISEKYFSWFKNVFLQLGKASYAFFLVHMLVLLLYREGLELFGFRYTIAQVPLLLLLCYFAALGFQKMSAKLVDMA